jgi:hypothetical protein
MLLAVLLMLAGGFSACEKNKEKVCNVKNPLTDLPWLKAKVEELTLLYQETPSDVAIYQCRYGKGQMGFLVDLGNIASFYNCEGEVLCATGGVAGVTCPDELNIGFDNRKLIWQIDN